MRGKKTDSEFLSDFISECIQVGIDTPEEMVTRAKSFIQNIDIEIRKVEQQKIIRSKLLDVINTFEKPSKNNKLEEIRALSFFQIQNTQICKFICDSMKKGVTSIKDLNHEQYSTADILFCIKQLLEHKIISKSGNYLLRGEMFNEYLKFVFKEA